MGLRHILGVFVAAVSVSALAPAFAATDKPNYFYNAATKTWIPTRDAVITPQGTIINNNAAAQAQRFLDGQGGFVSKNKVNANFPTVKKTVPITIDAKTSPSRVKLGAKNLIKGGVAGIVLSEGLQQLFDGLDWVMGEGGKAQKKVTAGVDPTKSVNLPYKSPPEFWPTTLSGGCPAVNTPITLTADRIYFACSSRGSSRQYCPLTLSGNSFKGRYNGVCQYGPAFPDFLGTTTIPLSDSDIDSGVESNYAPHLDDWEWLAPYMDPTAIEITDLPRLMSPPVTKTIYDADGNPVQVSETNIWHDFDIRNNNSARPEIDVKTTEETKVYEGGELVSTNTTTSTSAADSEALPTGGGAPAPELDIPTDCDFMPTVCAFLEWFQDDDPPEDPDLSVLIDDRDFVESYTIYGGSKQCPPPYELALPFIGQTYALSFEFACDFASKMYFFVMAAAYIFAAYISVGVARNG